MKYVRQFMLILMISFCGELLKCLLPLPIPASVYGFVLLFAGLTAGVGLICSWDVLRPILIPIAVITVVTTVVVMASAGRVTQWVIRMEKRNKE